MDPNPVTLESMAPQIDSVVTPNNSDLPSVDSPNVYSNVGPPNDDQSWDADSALGDLRPSTTETIPAEWREYPLRNGRTYHSYKAGKYLLPNDETEQDRLDLQNKLWDITLSGSLHLAPIPRNPKVIDVGTGTGVWAISFGDTYPNAHIIGSDLSPIQPLFCPPNVEFQMDDAEDEWVFSRLFNYVHWRMLFTCFKDPEKVLRMAYNSMDPDGIIEVQDAILPFQSDDASFDNTELKRWMEMLIDSAKKQGLDWTCASKYKAYIEAAGFVDIVEKSFYWPINPWPLESRYKTLGLWCMENLTCGVEAFSIDLLTKSGMSIEDVQILLINVRKDIQNLTIHAYIKIVVIYGRKPRLEEI